MSSNNNTIINDNNLDTNYNDNSNNNIKEKKISMILYKANSLTNIQRIKVINKNSKIKTNRHNSKLTGTTTFSYIKYSTLYYDRKGSKQIKKIHNINKK